MVIAVEASPEAIATLRENVAPYPNIVPLHAAIWDVPEQLRIANPGAETWLVQVAAVDADSSEANAGQGDLDVGTATISDLIRQYPDTTPFITKIDIEGAESALFRSNTEWMSAMVLIAIELHDRHYPFKFIGRNFYREIGKHNVEIVFSMENIFVFFRAPDDDRPV